MKIGDRVKIIGRKYSDSNNYEGRECFIVRLYSERHQVNGWIGRLWELKTVETGEQTFSFEVDLKVITNIIISSYSKCITETVRNKCIIIDNDNDMYGNNKIAIFKNP